MKPKIESIVVTGSYTVSQVPATYKTESEMVLIEAAKSIKKEDGSFEELPARYKTKSKTVLLKPAHSKIVAKPALNQVDQQHRKKKIELPPGHFLLGGVEKIFSPKTYRACEEVIADWHQEYFEALDANRGKVKMTFIRIRHTSAFLKALGLLSIFQVIGKLAQKVIGAGSE